MSDTTENMLHSNKITSHTLFIAWLRENEVWLMERVLTYAKEYGYTKYTSTLLEPWRISIVGLTDSLDLLMRDHPIPPPLNPDDSYAKDPASVFGLLEAQRHRSRGVNFAMFISLFKYYRQAYHDLIEANKGRFEQPQFYYEYIKVFFDRVEIAYSIEWHGRSSEEQIHDLSVQNRSMTNEKNLYLTVFDSFSSGAILLDTFGVILNYNQSVSEVLFGTKHHGGAYYYSEHKTLTTPEWISDAITDLGDNESYRFYFEQIREEKRYVYDVFIRPMDDISGKFSGFILIMSDVTELTASKERFELAISATKDGLWDWNLIDKTIYFSPQWKLMLGYRDDELDNTLDTWEKLLHPDDFVIANQAVELSLNDPSVKYEVIYRMRHKQGHYIWNLDRGEVLRNANGNAARMIGFHTDITQLKELEENLSLLKAAVENAPMSFIITNSEGNIEYVNPWFSHLTGYSFEEALGANPKILKSGLTPLSEYEQLWDEIIHKHVWRGTFKNLKKNGEEYWESATIVPIRNEHDEIIHYLGLKQEITESQHLKELLLQKEEMIHDLGLIVEEATTEIYIFDAQTWLFSYANKSALHNMQYTLEEIMRLMPSEIKQYTRNEFQSILNLLQTQKNINFTAHHQRKDGTIYPVSVNLQYANYHYQKSYVAMITDMSEQASMEKEIHDTQELMIAQSRHAAMGEMIGMIAHQWRQPLSIISMVVNNMILDIELEEFNEKGCLLSGDNILEQINYLSKTIDDFRDFFRLNKQQEEVNIATILYEAKSMIGASFENNEIILEVADESHYAVQIYSRELLQVMINILKNAKEALISNTAKERKIFIHIFDEANEVVCEICDNGGGIDPHILPKIFDPYFSTKDEKTGTGLGLYMSKTIVEKHLKGAIEAYNIEGGSCFQLRFTRFL